MVRENEGTNVQVAEYLRLDSGLFWTIPFSFSTHPRDAGTRFVLFPFLSPTHLFFLIALFPLGASLHIAYLKESVSVRSPVRRSISIRENSRKGQIEPGYKYCGHVLIYFWTPLFARSGLFPNYSLASHSPLFCSTFSPL